MGSGLIALQGPPGRQRAENGGGYGGRRQDRRGRLYFLISILCNFIPNEAKLALGNAGHFLNDGLDIFVSYRRFCPEFSDNENNQAERAISTGKLHALPRFHIRPIDVVVFHGSSGRNCFEAGFPLRCLQRLSIPHIATLHCGWRHNRSTRDVFTPVLSY